MTTEELCEMVNRSVNNEKYDEQLVIVKIPMQ